jgi:hypothetical protein
MVIISGGQTGVDRAALDVALDLGLPCGGYCPLGRAAEDGIIPDKYPLQSLLSGNYPDRTLKNVLEADATLIIFNKQLKGGTWLTADMCRNHHKPMMTIDAASQDRHEAVELSLKFIVDNQFGILNVAGPRRSQWPEGYGYAYDVLNIVLQRIVQYAGD